MPMMRRAAPGLVTALLAVLVLVATSSAGRQGGGDGDARLVSSSSGDRVPSGRVSLDPLPEDDVRPNIVVIMADDMRDDEVKYMPNVERLIGEEGVRFDNMFSPQPLCCPARASFLSGMYTHNHKVWSHADPFGFRAFDDDQTLPVWLNQVGYNTAFLGKYLNGYGRQTLPDGSPSVHYVPPGWTDWSGSVDSGIEDQDYNGGTYRYFDTTLNVDGLLQPHQGRYNTWVFGDRTRELIDRYSRSPKPFFIWASYVAPHHGSPFEPDDPGKVLRDNGDVTDFKTPARPEKVKGMFDDEILRAPGAAGEKDVSEKPFFIRDLPPINDAEEQALTEVTRQRAEALAALDEEVGNTLDELERTGELDNTLVVFTSDNGYFLGEHRDRQGKILPYEPSLRVPLLMRGPGVPAGEHRQDPFTMIDFAPTFLDAAGAQPEPSIDGTSLLDVARTGDQGWTRGIFTETGPRHVGSDVEESDNFLVLGGGPSPLRFSQGMRVPNYLYVEHASREKELYDLRSDPEENDNLIDQPARRHVQTELAHLLDVLRNCVGAQCRVPIPEDLQVGPGRDVRHAAGAGGAARRGRTP
jgi:N-acetylglucosamine-6-sulfatase